MKKTIKRLLMICIALCCMVATSFATYTDFLKTLQQTDIDIEQLQQQPSISRYDMARLLNLVECKDCVHAPQSMVERYTQNRWSDFVALPDKDFWDVSYQGGEYKNESYYYCVAYVGDQQYMRGFPEATSPVCGGQFCGQNNATVAELIQVLINISSQYIYDQFSLNRKEAQLWLEELTPGNYQDRSLSTEQKQLIRQKATQCQDRCSMESTEELKTYLSYCMFNLEKCDMHSYPGITQGARPVAELNILEKVDVLGEEELGNINIHELPSADKVLRILYKVFGIVDCGLNTDYDCDGLDNKDDNCPNHYNPSQKDMDQDKLGDVCDDDIDGDGWRNPINIIDESENINIEVTRRAQTGYDTCYLDSTNTNCEKQVISYTALAISLTEISEDSEYIVSLQGFTNGDPEAIKRYTSDGSTYQGPNITHSFPKGDRYTIKAELEGIQNLATAQTTIDFGDQKTDDYLAIKSIAIENNQIKLIPDTNTEKDIQRQFNNTILDRKADQSYTISQARNNITQRINASIYENDQLRNIATATIHPTENSIISSHLYTNNLSPIINQNVNISTIYDGFQKDDIIDVLWIINGTIQTTKELSIDYSPISKGIKVIENQITLRSGIVLKNRLSLSAESATKQDTLVSSVLPQFLETDAGIVTNIKLSNIGIDQLQDYTHLIQIESDLNVAQSIIEEEKNIEKSFFKNGPHKITQTVYRNQCEPIISQATIVNTQNNDCDLIARSDSMGSFVCDMDQDSIPDICDDDIDGDGIKNLIGIITKEYSDCHIDEGNLNIELIGFQKPNFIGFNNLSCQLDNCPFTINADQSDVNIDGQGDSCQYMIEAIIEGEKIQNSGSNIVFPERKNTQSDTDFDGIPDDIDSCPQIPEEYNGLFDRDGCPELRDNPCQIDETIIPNIPDDDYCLYPYPEKCVCEGLTTTECCEIHGQDCNGQDDDGEDENQCSAPYGVECLCFGLNEEECCDQYGFDCQDDDYCKAPFPQRCQCSGLTQQECCDQFGLDCDGDSSDDEDENKCSFPYGQECLCFGLSPNECCELHGFDCEDTDYCGYPYPENCTCRDLSQEQCCDQYGQDCPIDYCEFPYPEDCQCAGLSEQECCDQHGQDCDGNDDPGENGNECNSFPYGIECICYGLSPEQCCQQHGFNCEETDYCQFPYPENCQCVGLSEQECCDQYGQDCDGNDDPGENDNSCNSFPYGPECLCYGLSPEQCCQQHDFNCEIDDDDGEDENQCSSPYSPECLCFGLSQQECCQLHGFDCEDDDYCGYPYPENCTCIDLSQQECCDQYGQDCPIDYCEFPYPDNCQCVGLSEQECCDQYGQDCNGDDDPGENDNSCVFPYGPECLCFGLTAIECCQQHGFNCEETDYCQFPYPDNCQCVGLSEQECCDQHGQDCDGNDDPGENDNSCNSFPYGSECLCDGLSQEECCQLHDFNCNIDDDDGEDENQCTSPYSPECLCFGLSEQECCELHGFDCEETDYCSFPYPEDCICTGLSQEECCDQYGQDCDDNDDPGENEDSCSSFPYGSECLCFGLSQEECCNQYGFSCEDDYCSFPYPDDCSCAGLTQEECCGQHGLDCPGQSDDPDEDCEYPYGDECACFGMTEDQCCELLEGDCEEEEIVPDPPGDTEEPENYITPIACDACPCQYADFLNDIQKGSLLRAFLRDISQQYEYSRSESYSYNP